MKHVYLPILLSLVLVPVAARPAQAQTADDVIQKHIAAIGGRDALSKITSRRSTGTITIATAQGNISGDVEFDGKAPNKSRVAMALDLSAMGVADKMMVDTKFNGTTGVSLNSLQGDSELSGNQLDNMRNNVFPTSLLTYKELGFTMELLPKEKVNGKDAFVIRATPKAGSTTKLYFDAVSYMLVKTVATVNVPMAGGDIEQTSEQSDFRKVDGITLPFMIVRSDPAQTATIKLTKVEHNVALDDRIFSK
jgi:outer membrane lipoprotein-sorting protein